MTEKKTTKLDRYQRRYLEDELRSSRSMRDFAEPNEPAKIKQARKMVEGWDNHVSALRRSYDGRRAKLRSAAFKMLNFGTPEQALAAVEAYKGAV